MAQAMFAIWVRFVDGLSSLSVEGWAVLRRRIFTSYHPEQHYMRGPGPKWHEKHPSAPMV